MSGSKTQEEVVKPNEGSKAVASDSAPPSSSPPAKSIADDTIALGDDDEPVREEPIEDFYELGKEIGRGGFSVVVEAIEKKTGDKCAIKCIKKTMVEGDDIKLLRREIKIMKRVSHPNILKLYEVFEDEDEFFLVMEL